MLLLKPDNSKERVSSIGFTFFEILLVITLMSFLLMSFLQFFVTSQSFFEDLITRSEILHQMRTGMEVIVSDLYRAKSESICLFGESISGTFTEIQFKPDGSEDLYWFYLNSDNSIIKGVKRPGFNWGRTVIASGIDYIGFIEKESKVIEVILFTNRINRDIRTCISVGN